MRKLLLLIVCFLLATPAYAVGAASNFYPKDNYSTPAAVEVGTDGSTWNYLEVDANGWQRMKPEPTRKTTYTAATAAFATAATPTDIWIINGSASKTIKILRIEVSATQTTGGVANAFLIKRSTANSGGTAVAATVVPNDSTNAAGTATVNAYTANPTPGTTVGNVVAQKLAIPAPASVVTANPQIMYDSHTFAQPITLRGTAEGLALNLGGTTLTGGSVMVNVKWTEE